MMNGGSRAQEIKEELLRVSHKLNEKLIYTSFFVIEKM
jgi:hypothetical protein